MAASALQCMGHWGMLSVWEEKHKKCLKPPVCAWFAARGGAEGACPGAWAASGLWVSTWDRCPEQGSSLFLGGGLFLACVLARCTLSAPAHAAPVERPGSSQHRCEE